jgi:flagellar basal body L-ring protein FlgH
MKQLLSRPGNYRLILVLGAFISACQATTLQAQSGSLLITRESPGQQTNSMSEDMGSRAYNPNDELQIYSIFTVRAPEPRQWLKHDLVHIIIRETSQVNSSQEASSEKEYTTSGQINALPFEEFQRLVLEKLKIGEVDVKTKREFEGQGDYSRDDDFTARITARVMDTLPNGHLVIEAKTLIETDDEHVDTRLSGICDPDDVSPAGSILSSDIYDLRLIREHEGELRRSTKKGLFGRVLDTIFAF